MPDSVEVRASILDFCMLGTHDKAQVDEYLFTPKLHWLRQMTFQQCSVYHLINQSINQ